MIVLRLVLGLGAFSAAAAASLSSSAQTVNKWLRTARNAGGKEGGQYSHLSLLSIQDEFPEQYFSQPLDHFSDSLGITFGQRYWVNSRHYVKGGPVIVLDGGETSGVGMNPHFGSWIVLRIAYPAINTDRLPFLDTGIVDILAQATNGLGIVLEHRYYGNLS
jgi:hypothetical protein